MEGVCGKGLSAFPALANPLAGIVEKSSDRPPLPAAATGLIDPKATIDLEAWLRVLRTRKSGEFANGAV